MRGKSRAILEYQRKVEDGLSVVGVRIAFLPDLHGSTQIGFGLVEAATAQVPESRLVQTAHIVGITAQGFLVIVEG